MFGPGTQQTTREGGVGVGVGVSKSPGDTPARRHMGSRPRTVLAGVRHVEEVCRHRQTVKHAGRIMASDGGPARISTEGLGPGVFLRSARISLSRTTIDELSPDVSSRYQAMSEGDMHG